MADDTKPAVKSRTPKTLSESNAEICREIEQAQKNRTTFLLSQAPMFKHFISPDAAAEAAPPARRGRPPPSSPAAASSKSGADAPSGKKSKKRLTEKEEDQMMMESAKADDQSEALFQTTRLTVQPGNVTGQMRPYQLEGLNFLIGLFERGLNGILADEMGLGKTLQTISLLAFLRKFKGITGPHLIIVPKSTLGNWMNEIKRWCPEIRAVKFHGTPEERDYQMNNLIQYGMFDAVVTSYEVVTREKNHLRKFAWRFLIIDEAHRIKNENAQLSVVVRMFTTQGRLLITGTPLQNNLHELWALLNFLLPDVFAASEVFQKWFSSVEEAEGRTASSDAQQQKEIIQQLHAVLRPFLIRRLKHEVEHSLPPKKETVLFTKLTEMQLGLYRNLLKKDVDAINGRGGDRVRLLNILMQLRKCCNHPYLFDGVEDRSLDPFGDHLVQNCGKLALLDTLLPRLKQNGHRVLVFSQMTRVLDILEDFCTMRQHSFCRIDGSTNGDLRDQQIADFNKEGSDIFMFLLSTRAGGLGINLATADTVVLFDSDWNAQCDLQAMDRAHRIGQRKPVNVYRLITENSVEERILRRAMSKLRLDTLVIQQGRLATQKKNLAKDDLLDMIRYGADKFFKSNTNKFEEEDIEVILARGAEKTKKMNEEIEDKIKSTGNMDMLDFKLDGDDGKNKSIFNFEGVDYKKEKPTESQPFVLDVGKRVRSKVYDEGQIFREQMRAQAAAAEKKTRLKYRREPALPDHMMYDVARLKQIFQMERDIVDKFNSEVETALREERDPPELPNPKDPLLPPDVEKEREKLLNEGFASWSKRDFTVFLRAVERHGRKNIEKIAADLAETKSEEDVVAFSKAFWERGPKRIESWPRVIKGILEGEQRIARREDMERALQMKINRYDNPWKDLDISYGASRSKVFVDEEDRWLVCMTNKLGYGRWDDLKMEVRKTFLFRFNWFMKSRTPVELKRRVDALIRLVEKENEDLEEAAKIQEKRKKNAERRRHTIPDGSHGQSSHQQSGGHHGGHRSNSTSQKKRKTEQSQVDAYFAPKPKVPKT